MKRCLLILGLLLLAGTAHAATWYAGTSSANINAVTWYPTSTGSCAGSGTPLSWGSQANGDTFNANGCTAIAVNVDPGGVSTQVTLTSHASLGGGFTYATATNITIHAHVTSGSTVALTITGATGGGTIAGNITGGTATSARGPPRPASTPGTTALWWARPICRAARAW